MVLEHGEVSHPRAGTSSSYPRPSWERRRAVRKQKGPRYVCRTNGRVEGEDFCLPPPKTPAWTFAKPRKQPGAGVPCAPTWAAGMNLGVLRWGLSHQPHTKWE